MKATCCVTRRRVIWGFAGGLALAVLVLGIAQPRPDTSARADTHTLPAREAFLSGGERSEIVLKEILATLKQIDGRLERFEQALRNAEQQGVSSERADREASDAPPVRREAAKDR